ncbi:GntR family transcriptional regulator [Luteipulveratus sp. YIM 133132]|uniref:GntR family transcriptional regulator n=1 Tax=Luteipulveratus flavus TaxID=3031728 RepID=UPI0023B1593E|nr:GntR family transcriptional regulator [Luteipulveratus sp. YIM 133132]MDE9367065.1 GntR family transcriptional regulator [Luteipulveratus sp. YIM 133132]
MVDRVPVTLDRRSPVPLYHQLAEQLREAVTSGRLQPGDPFENELALAERLGLSRPTVRRAIQDLVAQGLLLRRRGLGTTVANRQIHRRAELTSLYDDLQRHGETPSTTVLDLRTATDETAARALGVPADTPLHALIRLRSAGERPFAILRNWLPSAVGDVTRTQLERDGLYAVLRERGVRPVVAHQTIGARRPTAPERRRLALRATDPVLTMTRAAFDATGNPVEYGDHIYRADAYTIDVTIDER